MNKALILILLAINGYSLSSAAVDPSTNESLLLSGRGRRYEHFRFELSYGVGKRFIQTPAISDQVLYNYIEKLKKGANLSISGTYFLNESNGLGLSVDDFSTKNHLYPVTVTYGDGTKATGELSDNMNITFYALTYSARRQNPAQTGTFLFTAGLGYIRVINKAVLINPMHITGQSLGSSLHVNYELKAADHWYIGIKAGILSGMLTEVIVNGSKRTAPESGGESLLRGTLSAGIRYTL